MIKFLRATQSPDGGAPGSKSPGHDSEALTRDPKMQVLCDLEAMSWLPRRIWVRRGEIPAAAWQTASSQCAR